MKDERIASLEKTLNDRTCDLSNQVHALKDEKRRWEIERDELKERAKDGEAVKRVLEMLDRTFGSLYPFKMMHF